MKHLWLLLPILPILPTVLLFGCGKNPATSNKPSQAEPVEKSLIDWVANIPFGQTPGERAGLIASTNMLENLSVDWAVAFPTNLVWYNDAPVRIKEIHLPAHEANLQVGYGYQEERLVVASIQVGGITNRHALLKAANAICPPDQKGSDLHVRKWRGLNIGTVSMCGHDEGPEALVVVRRDGDLKMVPFIEGDPEAYSKYMYHKFPDLYPSKDRERRG